MRLFLISDVCQELGVSEDRIKYAHLTGRLPEPERLGGQRVYTSAEVARIREFFADPRRVGERRGRRKDTTGNVAG